MNAIPRTKQMRRTRPDSPLPTNQAKTKKKKLGMNNDEPRICWAQMLGDGGQYTRSKEDHMANPTTTKITPTASKTLDQIMTVLFRTPTPRQAFS
jgi:hypothetical protein